MLTIKNEVKDKKYYSLILYAMLRCDAFSFAVPDLYTKASSDVRSKEYETYKKSIGWRLNDFKPFVLKEYTDTDYFGSLRENYSEIYVMSLNNEVLGQIMATEGLYSWKYPNMPEDLCLFQKGKCWLKSIAHEKKCWIYTDNEVEKDILKKVIGLKFTEIEEPDIPALDYHM